MNSKQRVLTAFAHQETDRVPLDYLGAPEISAALMRHFSIPQEPQSRTRDPGRLLFDFVDADTGAYEGLLDLLHIDFRLVKPDYIGPAGRLYDDPDAREDIYGCRHKRVVYPTHDTYELSLSPLAEATSVTEVDAHSWPDPGWFEYGGIADRCAAKSQYALAAGKIDLMGAGAFLQGMENFLIGLVENDPVTICILDHLTDFFLGFNQNVFESAGGQLDIAWYGDDYGAQSGLLIGAGTWRKRVRPHLVRLIEMAKSYGLKVMLHSCGSVRELIPDLIDVGVDILDTLQPEAAGMDPGELKRLFGDRICFHGAVSTAGVLAYGSAEDVRKEVADRIGVMAPGGGFCLAPTHTIMPNTPVENVLAMYESALDAKW